MTDRILHASSDAGPGAARPSRGVRVATPAGLLAVALASAFLCGAAPDGGTKPGFWEKREAAYRDGLRGPFTAIRAEYLTPGDEVLIWATGDSVYTGPGPGEIGAHVAFSESGFRIAPAAGSPGPPTRGGEPIAAAVELGNGAGSSEDFRLGRFLLSFGLQGEGLGRVLLYDPDLLEKRFHGFPVFPESDRFRVRATLRSAPGDTLDLGTTRGLIKPYVRAAILEFAIDGVGCELSGFRDPEETDGPLFVPYRDATSGGESYGVGRYLQVDLDEGGKTGIVDFNRSTNPWCAYSPFYNCVLPPEENRLKVAIRAGERAPANH